MRANQAAPRNVDEYIAGFPQDVREILARVRATIRKAAPAADETIKYQIPTYVLKGNVVSFAAYKKHIGLYPAPTRSDEFKEELAAYAGKGTAATAQFPFDKPIPFELIGRIVKFLVNRNREKAEAKGKKK